MRCLALVRAQIGTTLARPLRPIDERLLPLPATDFDSPKRVEQTCHHHLAVLERITAGEATGAHVAIKHNINDGCALVDRAIANALARPDWDRLRDIELCHAG